MGPYDRALTPPSHSRQDPLLGSLIESQHREHQALYIRVLSARPGDGGRAASLLRNGAVTYSSHTQSRCVSTCTQGGERLMNGGEGRKMLTHTHTHSISFSSVSNFIRSSASTLFSLVSVSPHCSFSLCTDPHCSLTHMHTHTHTDQGNVLILLKG